MLVWRLALLAATACALAVERNDEHVDEAHMIGNFSETERTTDEKSEYNEDIHIDEAHLIDNSTEVERMENELDDDEGSHVDEAHLIDNSTETGGRKGSSIQAMERSSSGCPSMMETFGYGNLRACQPHLFDRTYVQQQTLYNGRPWFITENSGYERVLAYYPSGFWVLQPKKYMGTLMCNAFTRVCPQCPTAIGQNWYFWSGYSWRYAGNALTVVEGCGHDALKVSPGADYEVKRHQPSLHQPYQRQSNLFNGRVWFKSNDGQRVIAYRPGCGWQIQPTNYKGTLMTNAYALGATTCPSEESLIWKYWTGKTWANAGKGLTIVASYENIGKYCWNTCEQIQGSCNWCGTLGMCCKKGYRGNGCDGNLGIANKGHSCVPSVPGHTGKGGN